MWVATLDELDRPCVYPQGDLQPHELGVSCWCVPFEVDGVMVHVSADGREAYESDAYVRRVN